MAMNLLHTVMLMLLSVAFMAIQISGLRFTALSVDNHPCKAENLKRTNRYICDNDGNVICQSGWRDPDNIDPLHNLNPCLEPICQHDCINGECRAPDFCACEVGWEGVSCDRCIPLPGCEHGTCEKAFECKCEDDWEGAYCNIPKCSNCTHGICTAPNECSCRDGWTGEHCDQCQAMPGCLHGHCGEHPHTCVCNPGWQGHLCDEPVCNPPCVHGFCHKAVGNGTNFCVCKAGWRYPSCDTCSPYWDCPNKDKDACNLPNECHCHRDEKDPNGLCNNPILATAQEHKPEIPKSPTAPTSPPKPDSPPQQG